MTWLLFLLVPAAWVVATQVGWALVLWGTPWSWRTLVWPNLQIDWLEENHPDWWRHAR